MKKNITCKVVFVRNKNNHDWIPILSTNIYFTAEKIVKLYSLRWNIETIHHDIKQYFDFETGCQSNDYDALCAHATIVMLRYIYLALERRRQENDKTIGLLFYSYNDKIIKMSYKDIFVNAINDLENEIISVVSPFDGVIDINKIIKIFKTIGDKNIKRSFNLIRNDDEIINLKTLLESRRF